MPNVAQIVSEFTRFAGVGAIGTACHYVTFVSLVEAGGMNAVLASSAGFIVGALVNYILNHRYTFRSVAQHPVAAPRFFTVALVGMLLNGMIMGFLHGDFRLHYLLSQVIATGVVLCWNYLGSRLWVFRETS